MPQAKPYITTIRVIKPFVSKKERNAMADTLTGETVTPGDSQTPATTTSAPAPVQDNASAAEVERLRKEVEQANLRARQLENEAAARKKADEEAEAKRQEENGEYKTLLEQEREKRLELERESEAREAQAELSKAKADALKDFPDEVKTQAEELGIDLNLNDEAAIEAYKAKLSKLKDAFAANGKVTPNNGRTPSKSFDLHDTLQAHANGDKDALNQALNQIPWIQENTQG